MGFFPKVNTHFIPAWFERSARQWWRPKFDSDVLEEEYIEVTFPRVVIRLQICLICWLLLSVVYAFYLYFASPIYVPFTLLSLSTFPLVVIFTLTFFASVKRFLNLIVTVFLFILVFLTFFPLILSVYDVYVRDMNSLVFWLYTLVYLAIISTYILVPTPFCLQIVCNVLYTIVFEISISMFSPVEVFTSTICVRLIVYIIVHLTTLRLYILAEGHMRNAFTIVAQNLFIGRHLKIEKCLKEKMIHSVLPPALAIWVKDKLHVNMGAIHSCCCEEDGHCNECVGESTLQIAPLEKNRTLGRNETSTTSAPSTTFRPFNMRKMRNVSILFADIVNFTQMSSKMSAEQIVLVLNVLFGRFDQLCLRLGCEKIGTLGDCYYCVSGCPKPRADHAVCCVEVGLAMIATVHEVKLENCLDIGMRVGIHTGRIMCGILGTRRIKFDVWSNDVTLANKIESSGISGAVHISESTRQCLNTEYLLVPHIIIQGIQTYFIIGRNAKQNLSNVKFHIHNDEECVSLNSFPNSMPDDINFSDEVPYRSGIHAHQRSLSSVESYGDNRKMSVSIHQRNLLRNNHMLKPLSEEICSNDIMSTSSFNEPYSYDTMAGGVTEPISLLSVGTTIISRTVDEEKLYCDMATNNAIDKLEENTVKNYVNSLNRLNQHAYTNKIFDMTSDEDYRNPEAREDLFERLTERRIDDILMSKCVRKASTNCSLFSRLSIHRVSLFYRDTEIERVYRLDHASHAHSGTYTLSVPECSSLVDGCLSLLVTVGLVVVHACLHATHMPAAYTALCVLVAGTQCLLVLLLFARLLVVQQQQQSTRCLSLCRPLTALVDNLGWCWLHAIGAVLLILPALVTFVGCWLHRHEGTGLLQSTRLECILVAYASLVHFTNYTRLNCFVKSALVTIAACVFVPTIAFSYTTSHLVQLNSTAYNAAASQPETTNFAHTLFISITPFIFFVVLIWILNREFEINYRLAFYVNYLTMKKKSEVERMRNHTDWLLYNIIPRHVAKILRNKAEYSENHENVGVLFARIVNFDNLYDESYHGGKEYLRVLNEIISDFDDMLHRYQAIEKIKTIGCTYMAVSGLHLKSSESRNSTEHLEELLNFALEMQNVLDSFNKSLFEFNLRLRAGFNVGDLTSGVVGNTKLYYDVWGDTVNTASRMETTGITDRVQTTEVCARLLSDSFQFERRGEVYVKGKDEMVTCLVVGRRG